VPAAPHSEKTDSVKNLFGLMHLVSAADVIEKFEADYNNCVIRYGDMKKQLGEDMVKFVAPLREKAKAIRANEGFLKETMEIGAAKAGESARATLKLVKEAMGLKYF
jgi:tryptophanyl-tRNA synthetase